MKKILIITLILLNVSVFAQFNQQQNQSSMFSSGMDPLTTISVTISGGFILKGSYPASSTERVDQFISRLYTSNRNAVAPEFYADRNVKLIRANGEVKFIDLAKFRLTGDFSNNPYLKNDDIIVFPYDNLHNTFIDISGAVNSPKKFQFVEGDKLSDAILFAGGINSAYENVTEAEISRLSYSGNSEDVITIKISDNPLLKNGDRIRILAEENMRRSYSVTVSGEVAMPGRVYITKDSTTLREVIKKVGGFKETADLNRAELIRGSNVFESTFFSPAMEKLLMNRMSRLEAEDSLFFEVDNQLRLSRGNGNIDFYEVMKDGTAAGNFLVRSGDNINIPEKLNMVYVFGQVAEPGYAAYRKGEGFNYYISLAKGIGESAKDEVYLIKGTTRTWYLMDDDSSIEIEPGDFIWVPKEPVRNFNYYLSQVGSIASIIGSVATVVLLFVQMGK